MRTMVGSGGRLVVWARSNLITTKTVWTMTRRAKRVRFLMMRSRSRSNFKTRTSRSKTYRSTLKNAASKTWKTTKSGRRTSKRTRRHIWRGITSRANKRRRWSVKRTGSSTDSRISLRTITSPFWSAALDQAWSVAKRERRVTFKASMNPWLATLPPSMASLTSWTPLTNTKMRILLRR